MSISRPDYRLGRVVSANWYAILDIPDDCEFLLGDAPPRIMEQINISYRADLTKRLGTVLGTVVQNLGLLHRL